MIRRAAAHELPLDDVLPSAPDGSSIDSWLSIFEGLLRLPPTTRRSIREELASHLNERVRDLTLSGLDEHEAFQTAQRELGEAAHLARLFERTHRGRARRIIMPASIIGLSVSALVVAGVMVMGGQGAGVSTAVYEQRAGVAAPPDWIDSRGLEFGGPATLGDVAKAINRAGAGDKRLNIRWRELEPHGIAHDTAFVVPEGDVSLRIVLDSIIDDLAVDGLIVAWQPAGNTVEFGLQEEFDRRNVELASYDISTILIDLAEGYGYEVDEAREAISKLLTGMVEPESWNDNGGLLAQLTIVGGRMFVQAPTRMQAKVKWLLDQMESGDGPDDGRDAPEANAIEGDLQQFVLAHQAATEVAERLASMGVRAGYTVDPRTNSLIVSGPELVRLRLADVVHTLDVPANDPPEDSAD